MTEDANGVLSGPKVSLTWGDVFPDSAVNRRDGEYLVMPAGDPGVQFFVGRNGSGKSRAARSIAAKAGGRYVSTDRLTGVMSFTTSSHGNFHGQFRGIALDDGALESVRNLSRNYGGGEAPESMHTLRERPEVALRVTAFLRRALGRTIILRENAGFFDPYVQMGSARYSLFRDEGHGLRELVLLLVEVYRDDWTFLVVDEPELHLHPAMARLWLTELSRECAKGGGRRAVVVTHEPSLLRPKSSEDLNAIWIFRPGERPARFGEAVRSRDQGRVTSSLSQNSSLVSLLAFSPRPVLVEGPTDVAALAAALQRLRPPEVVAQTDLVECGGAGKVAMWHAISGRLGLDVRAIADLDALFAADVHRDMDENPHVVRVYREELYEEDPRTNVVIHPLVDAARQAGYSKDPNGRAKWLSAAPPSVVTQKGARVREIWRDAGIWLHPQGTLEDVLRIEDKDVDQARKAAEEVCEIDSAAIWCAYDLDPGGDLESLLTSAVEEIAHGLQHAQGINPEAVFDAPASGKQSDAALVDVVPVGSGRYRLVVKTPSEFAGRSLEFDRSTASADMKLTAAQPDQVV